MIVTGAAEGGSRCIVITGEGSSFCADAGEGPRARAERCPPRFTGR